MNDNQKQVVQWFPGHMAKTRRLIKESLPFVDLVTEIVDARVPMSSSNPELKEMIGNKPRIVLLNKCDVADEKATALWVEYYKKNGVFSPYVRETTALPDSENHLPFYLPHTTSQLPGGEILPITVP